MNASAHYTALYALLSDVLYVQDTKLLVNYILLKVWNIIPSNLPH